MSPTCLKKFFVCQNNTICTSKKFMYFVVDFYTFYHFVQYFTLKFQVVIFGFQYLNFFVYPQNTQKNCKQNDYIHVNL